MTRIVFVVVVCIGLVTGVDLPAASPGSALNSPLTFMTISGGFSGTPLDLASPSPRRKASRMSSLSDAGGPVVDRATRKNFEAVLRSADGDLAGILQPVTCADHELYNAWGQGLAAVFIDLWCGTALPLHAQAMMFVRDQAITDASVYDFCHWLVHHGSSKPDLIDYVQKQLGHELTEVKYPAWNPYIVADDFVFPRSSSSPVPVRLYDGSFRASHQVTPYRPDSPETLCADLRAFKDVASRSHGDAMFKEAWDTFFTKYAIFEYSYVVSSVLYELLQRRKMYHKNRTVLQDLPVITRFCEAIVRVANDPKIPAVQRRLLSTEALKEYARDFIPCDCSPECNAFTTLLNCCTLSADYIVDHEVTS